MEGGTKGRQLGERGPDRGSHGEGRSGTNCPCHPDQKGSLAGVLHTLRPQ